MTVGQIVSAVGVVVGAVGVAVAAWIGFWNRLDRNFAELRGDNSDLRKELRDDRKELRAEIRDLNAHNETAHSGLRDNIGKLTETVNDVAIGVAHLRGRQDERDRANQRPADQ